MHGETITADDEAGRWLRDHDPYYISKLRNKRRAVRYPYDTPYQGRYKGRRELPFSALGGRALRQAVGAGVDTCMLNMREDES